MKTEDELKIEITNVLRLLNAELYKTPKYLRLQGELRKLWWVLEEEYIPEEFKKMKILTGNS